MFKFSKSVKVTNLRNVLCQIPKAVVVDWDLQKGDTLELIYKNGEIIIRPTVQRRSRLVESCDGLAGAATTGQH